MHHTSYCTPTCAHHGTFEFEFADAPPEWKKHRVVRCALRVVTAYANHGLACNGLG